MQNIKTILFILKRILLNNEFCFRLVSLQHYQDKFKKCKNGLIEHSGRRSSEKN